MKNRAWIGSAAWLALVVVLAVAANPAAAVTADAVLLYPADKSMITAPVALVMAVVPATGVTAVLTIDGKPVPTQRMTFADTWADAAGKLIPLIRPDLAELLEDKTNKVVLTAAPKLSPGEHTIGLGNQQIHVLQQSPAPITRPATHPTTKSANPTVPAPAGWTQWRMHPPFDNSADTLSCIRCHETTPPNPNAVLGYARAPGSCTDCHKDVDVQLIHRHVTDSLAKCTACHDPHGSSRPSLLVASPDKLCIACHEAGHSKR